MAKKKSVKTGMTPNKVLVAATRSELPPQLLGVAGITMLSDGSVDRGQPGQAKPVKGVIKALVMPVDIPTLCVDTEGCAHDVVCHLADTRAAVVKTGSDSAYSIGRLEELMRRLNMGVERLKIELRKRNKSKKA